MTKKQNKNHKQKVKSFQKEKTEWNKEHPEEKKAKIARNARLRLAKLSKRVKKNDRKKLKGELRLARKAYKDGEINIHEFKDQADKLKAKIKALK